MHPRSDKPFDLADRAGKFDFLGLKTLSVIRNCCDMIHRTKGIELDMDRLPLDDATT